MQDERVTLEVLYSEWTCLDEELSIELAGGGVERGALQANDLVWRGNSEVKNLDVREWWGRRGPGPRRCGTRAGRQLRSG